MKLLELQKKLSKYKCFTPLDIERVAELSKTAVQKIVSRYTQKGIFVRIRNGLYTFKNAPYPSLWLIANKLYSPSYISFETALAYYGIIPESVYSITSATSKITRNFVALDKQFIFRKVKRNMFCGYKPLLLNGDISLIAEPEKALVDYLYFVYLKKAPLYERMKIKTIEKKNLTLYIKICNNRLFSKWVYNVIRKIN